MNRRAGRAVRGIVFDLDGTLVDTMPLVVRAVTLPGAEEGLSFYLMPDFAKLFEGGWGTFVDAVFAAMGQAFFTVSVGVGSTGSREAPRTSSRSRAKMAGRSSRSARLTVNCAPAAVMWSTGRTLSRRT